MPNPSVPALLLMIVRSRVPRRCSAATRCSGMPHRPKPPIMIVAPSGTSATASSASRRTLSIRRIIPAAAATAARADQSKRAR